MDSALLILTCVVILVFIIPNALSWKKSQKKENEEMKLQSHIEFERKDDETIPTYSNVITKWAMDMQYKKAIYVSEYNQFTKDNAGSIVYFTFEELYSSLWFSCWCNNEKLRSKFSIHRLHGFDSIGLSNEEYNDLLKKRGILEKQEKEIINTKNTYKEARSLENIDNQKAIELYVSIQNKDYRQDALDRLIILYRKTKQKEKEIQTIEWLIEEEQNSRYFHMERMQTLYHEDAEYIRLCYDSKLTYTTPDGYPINFFRKIDRLTERLRKLKNSI